MSRPIHIYDIMRDPRDQREAHPQVGDHWYTCRKHRCAEHVNWSMIGCERVGPFPTKDEADRVAEVLD